MQTIPPSPLAIVLAALSTFALGGLWYSPLLFGKRWAREVGLDEAALRKGLARAFGTASVCALVMSANLGFFVGGRTSLAFAVFAGVAAGAGWVATAIATSYVFARRSFALVAIDAGYHVVSYAIAGAIFGLVRP